MAARCAGSHGAAEYLPLRQVRHQDARVPHGQPFLAGLLELGGDRVLPLIRTDLPAVGQRDRGRAGFQFQLAGLHRRLGRFKGLEYLFELVVGCAGVLALEGDGADVERRNRGGKLLHGILRAGAAVVASHQRGAKNESDKGK